MVNGFAGCEVMGGEERNGASGGRRRLRVWWVCSCGSACCGKVSERDVIVGVVGGRARQCLPCMRMGTHVAIETIIACLCAQRRRKPC